MWCGPGREGGAKLPGWASGARADLAARAWQDVLKALLSSCICNVHGFERASENQSDSKAEGASPQAVQAKIETPWFSRCNFLAHGANLS